MHVSSRVRTGAIAVAALALSGATLVAAPTAAHAAPTFAVTDFSATATTMTVPTSTTTYQFTLTFAGASGLSYETYDRNYSSGKIALIDGVVASPSYLSLKEPSSLTPGQPATYQLNLDQYTTPGKYRITFPITQWNGGSLTGELTPSVEITVLANPAITLAESDYSGYGKYSKKSKWTWSYDGPSYLSGASVKVYYKAKGKKKYVKVASSTLSSTGYASFKGKKGSVRKKGSVYFLIGGVAYSAAVKGPVLKLVRV